MPRQSFQQWYRENRKK